MEKKKNKEMETRNPQSKPLRGSSSGANKQRATPQSKPLRELTDDEMKKEMETQNPQNEPLRGSTSGANKPRITPQSKPLRELTDDEMNQSTDNHAAGCENETTEKPINTDKLPVENERHAAGNETTEKKRNAADKTIRKVTRDDSAHIRNTYAAKDGQNLQNSHSASVAPSGGWTN